MIKIILITLCYILVILNFALTKKMKSNYEKINRTSQKEMKRQDFLIDMYKVEQGTLLQNAQELRDRITDLENNVEILVNNLSAQKKKLIRPDNQN